MNKHHNEKPSNEAIQAALSFIPSNDRELWLKVGMALKAELSEEGFSLFDRWSSNAENYAPDAVKSVWKGFKTGGKISIGTLLYEAKQRGFNLKEYAHAPPLSSEEMERLKHERLEREQAEQREIERLQSSAAMSANKAWTEAHDSGESNYLNAKQVQAHGVRFASNKEGQTLLIPLIGISGKLWNLQRIFSNGDKRFYKGGKTAGCFHIIGKVEAQPWLLIAEGYATAASLHEATGYPVVIAFSASNLKHIASMMRERHPDKSILLCADNDQVSALKTGKNAGVVSAAEAASHVGGFVCIPEGLPEDGNDFNDLMRFSGIAAVKQQIEKAIQQSTTPKQANATNQTPPYVPQKVTPSRKPKNDTATSKPFYLNHENGEGVFYHGFHEGEPLPALKICSSLKVVAKTRDASNGEWGYLLEFSDPDGHQKRWAMPAKMLSGDGTQYRADLLAMGLMIEPGLKQKNHLTTYIQTADILERVRCVERIGWHDGVYVLPDRTIGETTESILFQTTGNTPTHFKQSGTLDDWKREIAAHCSGNSRLLFFTSAGFASLLLHHAKVQSFGLHLMGSSSTGKSTAMKVAASIFGGADYAQSWHVTDNSLEATAQKHSDALLILDELGQADAKMVGNIAYMLSNEKGKGRATQNATAKKIVTWRLIFLSDGELSLEAKMAEAGKTTKGGQDVRMAHINADAGQNLGLFDTVHSFADGAALSRHLVSMSQQYYGTAGLHFIEWLVQQIELLPSILEQSIKASTQTLCPANAHGQVKRVADFFSLVAAGGELATAAGITGWQDGEATQAATTCFNDWLASRGGAGDIEHAKMLELLPNFLQVHGDARFAWEHRAMDDHAPKTINQAGFKRMVSKSGKPIKSNTDYSKEYGDKMHPDEAEGASIEYYLLPKVFKEEVCKGFDARIVAAKLSELGVLATDKEGKCSINERFAGTQARYYKVHSEKLAVLHN